MDQVYFNDIGNYDEWGLRLVNLNIGAANPKFHYVDIPSGDGSLDLTESLTGEAKYEDRNFEAVLRVNISEYIEKIEIINNLLHGKKVKIQSFEKPNYYLIGRCSVDFQRLNHLRGNIIITAICEPWYYKNELTIHKLTIPENGSLNVGLFNSRKRVIPRIITDQQITINFNNKTMTVNAGTHRLTGVVLTEGNNSITITGDSGTTIEIEYQEGAL